MIDDNSIIALVIQEKTDREIAEILNYSIPSVKRRLRILYKKYKVKSRVGLVREVVKAEIIKDLIR